MPRKSVLLADDEPLFRRAATLVVREEVPEVEVRSAANGALALAAMEASAVDLLVTDLAMPVLGGTSLLAGVLRIGRPLPVVVLTAHTTPDFVAWAERTGALGVLSKPVRFETLSALVRQAVEGRSTIAPFRLEVLCRLLTLELASVELTVLTPSARGSLHFLHGVLRHAETASAVGVPAAVELLSAETVFPELRPLPVGGPVTIRDPLAKVLEGVPGSFV